jgi:hypothetical protein
VLCLVGPVSLQPSALRLSHGCPAQSVLVNKAASVQFRFKGVQRQAPGLVVRPFSKIARQVDHKTQAIL